MGYHPINLAFRFLLELAGVAAFVIWGRALVDGWWGWVLGFGVAIAAMALWATFAVPEDESRSGKAPVPVPGWVRLSLELLFFGLAVWALDSAGLRTWAMALAVAVAVHYSLSWDRIGWLANQR
jgi:hypothetical protein